MAKMEADLRVMDDLKDQLEKGRNNFRKSPKDRITESYVMARLEGLEELIIKFSRKHESIISTYKTELLENYTKKETFNDGYETYLIYKGELKAVLQLLKPSTSSGKDATSSKGHTESVVRLPKISIPVFSGGYAEWSTFKDLFISLVHTNDALDDVQRLHYLKTQLRGEAEQLIRHIPITQANYIKAWELLQNRFDNKRYMSNCTLKRLFGQRSMNCESSHFLKQLLDTTSDCIHELSNLGIKDYGDLIIVYIISLKLDPETRKQWELHINTLPEELPSFAQFKEFLELRYRALEFVEPSKTKFTVPKPYPNSNPKVLHNTEAKVICPHCTDNHKLFSCQNFTKEDVPSRREIVKSLRLCFNCLGNNHTNISCRVPTRCRICKGKHHTLLHGPASPLTVAVATDSRDIEELPEPSLTTNETTQIKTHFVTGNIQTLLATALIRVQSPNGHAQILRALLDQGSQASFISEAAVQLLRLKKTVASSSISGLGGGQSGLTTKYVVKVNIQSLHDPAFKLQIKAHVLKTVTSILPERKFVLPSWKVLQELNLADPQYNAPNKIDILLGAEVYCSILKKGLLKSPTGMTIAQDTYLGWVLSGQVEGYKEKEQQCHNVIVNMHLRIDDNDLLKRFWELESEPKLFEKVLTPEEQACEQHYKATTSRDDSGRYIVELPFRTEIKQMKDYGDTRAVAVKRLFSLEKRLDKDKDAKNNYSQVLNEYLLLGHMEKIPKAQKTSGKVWLPHHAVVRMDKTTTKTRVVFNASERGANGISLNDTLMVGPTIQPELRHIILRWRMHPICLTADIVKMYRQVKLADKHVDYQRIVWREDVESDIQDYRLLTVTFGTSCAPYLAVKSLQQVADDEGQQFPLAQHRVKNDFYIDDLITGCQTEEEAINVYHQLNALLGKGGFTLQKWASNKIELLETLQENTGNDKELRVDSVTKILGLTWNRRTDEFDYSVKLSSDSSVPDTKRQIISEICRLYDPLGWMAPCLITAKIFIQKLWIAGLGWDDRVPEDLLLEWELYRKELPLLKDFHLPRWIHSTSTDKRIELHGFSDASNSAFAAVIYVRCISTDGEIESHLVTAKTKVAPINQVSTPRLELCGAVLVAKLLREVANTLNINKSELHAWTDSTIVLAWLSDHPSRWKTFIANRTAEILTILDSSQWSYVQSKDNPADCASRGITPTELINNTLWKYGPSWLCDTHIEYGKPISICTKTDLESRVIKTHIVTEETQFDDDICSKFSSLRKLVRVIAYCKRFLYLKPPKNDTTVSNLKQTSYLTATEIQEALATCIRQHQAQLFHDDIASLLKNQRVNKKSRLAILDPFLDDTGILRVGGRLVNSNLPDHSKHPIIISGDSNLANLIIDDAHQKTLHGGSLLTCNYVRMRYWVTKLKNLVRSHIHSCVPCIRYARSGKVQLMGQLPSCRVTPNKAFLNSGVDYAGPINMRVSKGRGQKSFKGYICLFICMSTRAVHLEAVSDLTSEGFLAAFKRFVARRGRCNNLWSDNGTNFVGAARELKSLLASERSSFYNEVASSLSNNGTEWHFIPPHAPNFGGLWEAGIKSTKHHLRRVIGDSTLTYEEMSTLLSQVEACLNSRPLSQISSDPNDAAPLTPGHFLTGEPLTLILAPDHSYEMSQIGTLRRWQLTQRMLQNFWRRWSKEYLTHFFQRYKWNIRLPGPKVGDVVLVREDNLPPAKWLYGRIVKVHTGKDNMARVVTLSCKGSLIQRPISKLCLLPITDDD